MKILALELSSAGGSIAWCDGSAEVVMAEFANDREHSGLFFDHLQEAVRALPNPDRIAVGLGPGSYAGTRIAIAAAIGLQAVTGAELVGIASVRAIAALTSGYVVVGDARRASFYYVRVCERQCIDALVLCGEDELRDRISTADVPVFSTEALRGFPVVEIRYPSARLLAELAPLEEPAVLLEPIYLRDPHITQPKAALNWKR